MPLFVTLAILAIVILDENETPGSGIFETDDGPFRKVWSAFGNVPKPQQICDEDIAAYTE